MKYKVQEMMIESNVKEEAIYTKKSFHHSGGIPVEFHWTHGKLLENDWNK